MALKRDYHRLAILIAHRLGLAAYTEHQWHTRPEYVSVKQADLRTLLGQGHRQICGHGTFTHTALARRHRNDIRHTRDRRLFRDSGMMAHVSAKLDPNLAYPRQLTHRSFYLGANLILQRARGRGQFNREVHHAAVNRHILDHPA